MVSRVVAIVLGGQDLVSLTAEDDDLVADGNTGHLADVEKRQIHADTADDGYPLASDQHLAARGEQRG